MAFLEELQFTGSLGDLSFYRMQGSDKIVVRRKGGARKETIKKSPKFAVPRLYMSEFGGCSKMGKEVRHMLHPMKALADYNFSGFINKSLKLIQKQDLTGTLGRRSIELSKHPKLLEGFQLNKYTTFDAMVRGTVACSVDTEKGTAQVEVPALVRDINFFPNNKHAKFSIMITLGVVPDFSFNPHTNNFEPPAWYTLQYACNHASSAWYAALKGSPATTVQVALPKLPSDGRYSLMVTVGICFGAALDAGEIQQVKRAGAAKILAVVPVLGNGSNGGIDGEKDTTQSDVVEPGPIPAKAVAEQDEMQKPIDAARSHVSSQEKKSAQVESGRSFMYTYVMKSPHVQEAYSTYTCSYTIPDTAERETTSSGFFQSTAGSVVNHWIQ